MPQAFRYEADMHTSNRDSAPHIRALGSKDIIERHGHRRGRTSMIAPYYPKRKDLPLPSGLVAQGGVNFGLQEPQLLVDIRRHAALLA